MDNTQKIIYIYIETQSFDTCIFHSSLTIDKHTKIYNPCYEIITLQLNLSVLNNQLFKISNILPIPSIYLGELTHTIYSNIESGNIGIYNYQYKLLQGGTSRVPLGDIPFPPHPPPA